MAQNNSVFFFRKFQTTVVEGQTQELTQTCNKSEITVFYMEKKQQIYWESLQVFDPHISGIVRFVVYGVAKLVLVSVVVEADNFPAPAL